MKQNIIGNKFHRLLVLKKGTKSGYYICKCDCGNVKKFAKSNLIKGATKSCGCYNKEIASSKGFDIINKRFGKLLVIGKDVSKTKKSYWICKCDCGKELSIQTYYLTSGKKKDCGCTRESEYDLVGKRFEMLYVISKSEKRASNGDVNYICKCDCGNIKEIIRSNLVSKSKYKTLSCGCYVKSGKHVEDIKDSDREFHMVKNLYCKLKIRHKKLGCNESDIISIDLFWDIIKQECYYCGLKDSDSSKDTSTVNRNYTFYHNGIDRIDSSKGYIKDNVVCCCKFCNMAKSNRTLEEFTDWYEKVYNYYVKND